MKENKRNSIYIKLKLFAAKCERNIYISSSDTCSKHTQAANKLAH